MDSIKQWLVNIAEPFYLNVFMPWFENMGFILYGGGKGDAPETAIDPQVASIAKRGTFKPFTITTSAGQGFGQEGRFGATASQPFQQVQQAGLVGAQQVFPALAEQTMRGVTPFEFDTDVNRLTQDYFAQQSQMLQPAFQQQAQNLQNTLFGSGRMGLSLAGESIGAGNIGMVQPDAFGLARAQSQTLADVGAQSRERALADAQTRLALEQGVLGTQEGLQQQRFQNLLAGGTGLFGAGMDVANLEAGLLGAGLSGEQVRGASYTDAARALAGGMVQGQASDGGKGLLGTAIGTAGTVAAASMSDIRLKDNIKFHSASPNGVSWYTWEWNDKARELGLDEGNTFGVIAQEVRDIYPEAVSKGENGYYQVNYDMIGA